MRELLSAEQIRDGVARVADEINAHYDNQPLTVVGVLTGSLVFLADLIRQMPMPLRVGVVQARSYRGTTTAPGPLTVNADMLPDVRDRHVLLVDDIFDTGHTLFELVSRIGEMKPASLRSVALLRKMGRQEVSIAPNYLGFEIPNEFVVGYGLDYDDLYRNLPYLAALEPGEIVPEVPR